MDPIYFLSLTFIILSSLHLFAFLRSFTPIFFEYDDSYVNKQKFNIDLLKIKKKLLPPFIILIIPFCILKLFFVSGFENYSLELIFISVLISLTAISISFNENNFWLYERKSKKLSPEAIDKLTIKPGPLGECYIYYAVKYALIQSFYPTEKLDTNKYKNQKDFLRKVCKYETKKRKKWPELGDKPLIPESLKNHYTRVKSRNLSLKVLISRNLKLIELMLKIDEFKDFPKVKDHLKPMFEKKM